MQLRQSDNWYLIFHWLWVPFSNNASALTHWGRATHICVGKLTIIGSDNGLSPWPVPSDYLNQCWNIVHWTIGNKFQCNVNRNWYIFIKENPFENVVWKMSAILSRPQCVKTFHFTGHLTVSSKIYPSQPQTKKMFGINSLLHDDVIKWKHFPRNWPFVRGIHRSRWIPHTKASDA